MDAKEQRPSITRILLLGGGFAGTYTARRLEKLFAGRNDVEIILVSRDNFLLMTPLLFEVCSGTLEASACSISIREYLRNVKFVEASVVIDLGETAGSSHCGRCRQDRVAYDRLVVALGGLTIPAGFPAPSSPSRSRHSPMPCSSVTMRSNGWSGRRPNPTPSCASAS